MHTRRSFESQGFTFRPGQVVADGQRFQFDDAPPDAMPPLLADLQACGYVLVDGGIMEPPKLNMGKAVLCFAVVMGGLYLGLKALEKYL